VSERHPVWTLLDKLQMDNRAQAAKLTELRAAFAAMALPDKEPPLPAVEQIRRQIANGALTDEVDLAAEMRSHDLPLEEKAALLSELRKRRAA
jgi:hypothetical protein